MTADEPTGAAPIATGRADASSPAGGWIVGLGNPGPRYAETRHNLGFLVVDELARRGRAEPPVEECHALVARCVLASGGELVLVKPETYMNRSGHAVRCLLERHAVSAARLLVVYDDVALPLGRLRLRRSGSPGGHRGMESVLESLGTDEVARLRLGILTESTGGELADFVLAPFLPEEREAVAAMVSRAADACEAWAREGCEAAMRRFNG